MKIWTVILAGVLVAALPDLGNGALEDAGVFVSNDYTTFEKRVIPKQTALICTKNFYEYEWFRIDKFEQILLDFENGNNDKKVKFSLGTPALLMAWATPDGFQRAGYCKYLPKVLHHELGLRSTKAGIETFYYFPKEMEYYAMKINDMERATIQQGWNNLLNVIKGRFPTNTSPMNYQMLIVEKTAAGVIYVGAVQHVP